MKKKDEGENRKMFTSARWRGTKTDRDEKNKEGTKGVTMK
jgi:hypothetical protein